MKKWMIAFLAVSIGVTGCQAGGNGDEDPLEGQTVNEHGTTGYNDWDGHSPNEIANHLANLCTELPEVRHATAVVIGPYAAVGLNLDAEMDQSDAGAAKYAAAEALQDDPYGVNAFVTADPDITARLGEMQQEIAAGHPVSGIMEELAAIVGRIMPVTPGPEHRKHQGDESDANDDRLEGQDQREMDDIQNKQSKGRKKEVKDNN
ncbi:YhcN/YlaJ family sporulation lipoprotein [Alteribacter natronophilus]|uniref:YhcN/YlaJ family sporulation lipoprotein n=1 Tax=Alteribacter natronophilus TaxID=2583810 RepID=UPI00110D8557|nr:YhcN/YlaJ family sporulation lipoprotein [Alteribacter natronophilus]TMW73053.1 YhcN/YlaJ family sporulation lipoprotein [Alteribacter natronophilus]